MIRIHFISVIINSRESSNSTVKRTFKASKEGKVLLLLV